MQPLIIAQYMAAAILFTVAGVHLLIWSQCYRRWADMLFAITAIAAGGNAISESFVYVAHDVGTVAVALKWYVGFSGLWAISFMWFVVAYGRVGRVGRWLASLVCVELVVGLAINTTSRYSLIYSDIADLRKATLPWGEVISHAKGDLRPLPLIAEVSMLMALGVVFCACFRLWRIGEKSRAVVFGLSVVLFILLFGAHANLVDSGALDPPYLTTYGFLAVVSVISFDMARSVVRSSVLSDELKRKEADMRAAVDDERTRIAGDLHDSVTQTLFSTAAIADALPDVWERYPDEARQGLEQLRQLTTGALAEMRNLLLELHPAALLERSLGELLRQLANGTAARARVRVEVQVVHDRSFPENVQVALYRIAQEALNNAIRHAHASSVMLDLVCGPGATTLTIVDDGKGVEPNQVPSNRLGLEIMRERAGSIEASFDVESLPEHGTTIRVIYRNNTAK